MFYGFVPILINTFVIAVFSDMWSALIRDVKNCAKEAMDIANGKIPDKNVYMSLPRPGVKNNTLTPILIDDFSPFYRNMAPLLSL